MTAYISITFALFAYLTIVASKRGEHFAFTLTAVLAIWALFLLLGILTGAPE